MEIKLREISFGIEDNLYQEKIGKFMEILSILGCNDYDIPDYKKEINGDYYIISYLSIYNENELKLKEKDFYDIWEILKKS